MQKNGLMKFITAKEAGEKWGIPTKRENRLRTLPSVNRISSVLDAREKQSGNCPDAFSNCWHGQKYISQIYSKTGITDRANAILHFRQLGY